MSILVTGGAGFIGSHLIERLWHVGDEPIVCLDDFNDFYEPGRKRANIDRLLANERVSLVEGTFCDAAAMQQLFAQHGVRRVVHLGAYAGVRTSMERPLIYQQTNVGGTLALLEAARTHPVERFLLASSSTVYGRGAQPPFTEDQPLGVPLSPYGASKRAAELFGLLYHDQFGVPVVCLRPFSVYGPRVRPDLALWIFAAAIVDGRPLPLFGDGSAERDFTHVRDICDGLIAALDAPEAPGQTINLGHNEPIAMRNVIATLEKALGRKAVIDQQPEKPGDMPMTCADLTKARRILGYQPKVPFEEGIREFAAWFLENR